MSMADPSLSSGFDRYFAVQLADTPEFIDSVRQLRYRVYCAEFGYEREDDCPDGRERDEYDDRSIHCLIVHRPSGLAAGTVRIVLTLADDPHAPLPFEQHCPEALDRDFIDGLGLDRMTVCEISRLAVDGSFRRRGPEERASRYGQVSRLDFSPEEIRTLPLIGVSAFLAATAVTARTGRTNAFAMMEPFLPRLLARSGIPFQRAGRDIDYHGIRAPYFTTTGNALQGMAPPLMGLYETIRARLYADTTGDPDALREQTGAPHPRRA